MTVQFGIHPLHEFVWFPGAEKKSIQYPVFHRSTGICFPKPEKTITKMGDPFPVA
jgi:hypothetical protein